MKERVVQHRCASTQAAVGHSHSRGAWSSLLVAAKDRNAAKFTSLASSGSRVVIRERQR